ncbi:unnamed protein product [Scytosiphon promiscuus]
MCTSGYCLSGRLRAARACVCVRVRSIYISTSAVSIRLSGQRAEGQRARPASHHQSGQRAKGQRAIIINPASEPKASEPHQETANQERLSRQQASKPIWSKRVSHLVFFLSFLRRSRALLSATSFLFQRQLHPEHRTLVFSGF